jgi:4-diphosphocytidyl-2-C-methyl-D-erythritol kinase
MLKMHAPAKVNLFLRVLAREESGFHQIETLFAALDLGDSLTLTRAARGIALQTEGPAIGPPEANLVYRAARAFLERGGIREGVEIRLRKRIPVEAGLGGGSSDAATALRGLATLFPGRVGGGETLEIARGLGADIPFFLASSPLALAWGRGDRLLPLPPLPAAPVLLALPPVGVPTARAYAMLARRRELSPVPGTAALHDLRVLSNWEGVAALAANDFEEVVLPEFPLLERMRKALEETGPRIALLSGSGSALFAVFRGEEEAAWARDGMEAQFPRARFLLSHTLAIGGDPSLEAGVEA